MFLGMFMEAFGTNRAATSMIGSIQMGATYCVGPIAANLADRFGCRETAISGSVIAATSIIISGIAPGVGTLYVTAGFFTGSLGKSINRIHCDTFSTFPGVGFGLIYLPATVCVATHFHKKRAIATGIATTGCGFGTFVFAPVISLLGDHFGWSWTLVTIGAVVLFCIPVGFLLKPINENESKQSDGTCEGTKECDDGEQQDISCLGCISFPAIKMGKGYSELLYDAKFLLYLMSILLMNIGFSAPYAYTVASYTHVLKLDSLLCAFLIP